MEFCDEIADDVILKKAWSGTLTDFPLSSNDDCSVSTKDLEDLIHEYYGLIIWVEHKFSSYLTTTFDKDDLHSTAIIGFIRASQLFNCDLGIKFSTYAYNAMKFQIIQSIETLSKPIRIPRLKQKLYHQVKAASVFLYMQFKRTPTHKEIANYCNESELTIIEILKYNPIVLSLETPISSDSDSTLHDFISDARELNFIDNKLSKDDLRKYLKKVLDQNEYFVIDHYYGLDNSQSSITFSQIAKYLGLSKERVRQIHNKALDSLKSREHSMYISELLT